MLPDSERRADRAQQSLVSIVILNWNSQRYIHRCLQHVFNQQHQPFEVIVVDNGSLDGSYKSIQERWGDRIVLVRNERNLGFAAGMNGGIGLSNGDYVLLLNSDCFLEPLFITSAVEALKKQVTDRVAMIAGIFYKDCDGQPSTEVDAVGCYLERYLVATNSKNICAAEWVFGSTGAAQFIRRAALDEVRLPSGDYLDSTYFAYGEDVELFLRLHLFGWKCLFIPVVAGWHIGAGSVGATRYLDKPNWLQVHGIKNRFFTILACYPVRLWLWTLPWLIVADVGQVAYGLATGRIRFIANWLRAVLITGAMLPYLYRKRRWVQARRCVSIGYLRKLFVKQTPYETLRSLLAKG